MPQPSLAKRIAHAIRAGACPKDWFFDQLLPYELRMVSGQHWTPLAVALRVANWLENADVETVVDVGSGAGKLCVAAALASRCRFIGIEQRPKLVEAATALARYLDVHDRVTFICGTLEQGKIPTADAYYLYNPFGENLFSKNERLGDDVEHSATRYGRDVGIMERFFAEAPSGTYVIKYNGFGGRMPTTYRQVLVDRGMPNLLRMWRKGGTTPPLGKIA